MCFTLTAAGGEVRDTCGSLVAKRLDATLAESGTYTITTRLQPIVIISHSLALERVLPASPQTTAIAYGETRTDTINVAGDLDVFSFNGAIGDTVSIQASAPGNFQPCIELIAPDNTRSGGGGCPLPTAPPGLAAAVNGVIVSLQWGSEAPVPRATYSPRLDLRREQLRQLGRGADDTVFDAGAVRHLLRPGPCAQRLRAGTGQQRGHRGRRLHRTARRGHPV